MRVSRRLLVGILVVAAGGGIAAWLGLGNDAADAALAAVGAPLYAEHCANCHGARLEGEPDWRRPLPDGGLPAPPHDVTGHTWHHPDGQLLAIIRDGGQVAAPPGFKSRMPAFGAVLSGEEIRAVLAYIKSGWPPEIRARQAALSAENRP